MKKMGSIERWLRHNILNSGMYNHGAEDMECPYCHNEVPVYIQPSNGMEEYWNSTACIKCKNSIKTIDGRAVQDTPETRELLLQKYLDDKAPECKFCNQKHSGVFPLPTAHYPEIDRKPFFATFASARTELSYYANYGATDEIKQKAKQALSELNK